jgi:hypothetical protein
MSQVKIYGLREQLHPIRSRLSDTIQYGSVSFVFPGERLRQRDLNPPNPLKKAGLIYRGEKNDHGERY